MSWQFTLYGIFLLLTAVGVFGLTFLLRHRRNTPGVGALAVMTLAAGLWALGAGLELIAADETYKLFWGKFQYLGIVWLPVGWFAFALGYTGRGDRLSWRNILLLSVIPTITLLLIFTNHTHGLIWSGTEVVRSGGILNLRLEHGPAFYVDWIYAYVLLLAGTVMLLLTLFHSPRAYQMQGSVLLFAVVTPWIGNALYILDLSPLGGKDPTPFSFAVCVAAMFYGISNLRLLDLAPLARNVIFDYIKDGVLVLDLHGRVVDANGVARSISELPRKNEVVGGEGQGSPPELGSILSGASDSGEILLGGRSAPRYYEAESYEMRDGKARPRGRMVLLRDVTERRTAQERLRQSEERYRAIMEQAAEGIFLCDTRSRRILEANAAFQRLLGYSAAELTSLAVYDLVQDDPADVDADIRLVETQGSADLGERRYRRKDNTLVDLGVGSSLVHYGQREVLCTVVRDLTRQKELERRLEHRAFHDPLTQLPNRELFTRHLQSALSGEGRIALLFVDLDDFKGVNDSLGHDRGDELLIGVANRLTHCLRPGDSASRLGGDEFTVIIGDAGDEAGARAVARRVEERLSAPFGVGGRTMSMGASIGLAFSEPGDVSAEELLRRADVAMYGAKRAGKSRLRIFNPDGVKSPADHPDLDPDGQRHPSLAETVEPE